MQQEILRTHNATHQATNLIREILCIYHLSLPHSYLLAHLKGNAFTREL